MFFIQLYLLIWKNYTIHKRRLLWTFVECLLPSVFAVVILLFKLYSTKDYVPDQKFSKEMVIPHQNTTVIGFVPNSSVTEEIIRWVADTHDSNLQTLGLTSGNIAGRALQTQILGFKRMAEAEKYFYHHSSEMSYIVEFKISELEANLPKVLEVVIHPYRRASQIWNTDEVYDFERSTTPRSDLLDLDFIYIQSLVSKGILAHWLKKEGKSVSADFPLFFKRFPIASYYEDSMMLVAKLQLTLFIVLGFMMCVFVFTKNIVQEKELQIKESMKLMGMNLNAFWISWYFTCFVILLPSITLYTVVLSKDLTSKGPVLVHSDSSIIFVLIMSYGLALTTFSFMVSCLVQKANDGAIAAGLLFLMEYVAFEILHHRNKSLTRFTKLLSCLLFNVTLGLANYNIILREARGSGVHWRNINETLTPDDISVLDGILMMFVDACIHLLLTWYLDSVFPGDFGIPKPFHFFLTKKYWCPGTAKNRKHSLKLSPSVHDPKYFEKDPEGLKIGIEIINLRKEFGSKVSVSHLSLKMFEGQITVLLGHNGAGKTTTMSMLTGFIPPTKGTAIINGYDICQNILGVRKSLSLCPQHDILFDVLTVKEHLWFFAHMKGYRSRKLNREIREMVKDLCLENKIYSHVGKMSGGQKRSLSMAISLIGGSKVVFLDEPSSGMDPSTRRLAWDVLQKHRKNRTILLSTHYMDEADALGDRIAIMASGVAKCCGTSLFLKKLFGTGYHLVIVKDVNCNINELSAVIQSYVQQAEVEYISLMEVSYLLPETECAMFPPLFRHLKANKSNLRILSFGTTATTMEEVFLKSAEESGFHDDISNVESAKSNVSSRVRGLNQEANILAFNSGYQPLRGIHLSIAQMKTLLLKRYIVAQYHWLGTFVSYLLPGILVLLFIIIDKSMSSINENQAELIFNISLYGDTSVVYHYDNCSLNLSTYYVNQFNHQQTIIDLTRQLYSDYDDYLLEASKSSGTLEFDREFIVGADFSCNDSAYEFNATILYNSQPYHAAFASLSLVMNAVIDYLLDSSYHIAIGVHPLHKEGEAEMDYRVFESHRSGFFVGMFVGIGFAMYASLVVHYLLKERQSGVKHMHALFGVSMTMYWLPTLIWDALSFVIPTIVLFVIFFTFDKWAFLHGSNWILVIFVIIFFIWAILPCTYACHFIFTTPSSGLAGMMIFNLFSVLLTDIVVFEFTKPGSQNKHLGRVFAWIFAVFFPVFNLSHCFNFILKNYEAWHMCQPKQDDCRSGIPSICCSNQPDLCRSTNPQSVCIHWQENYTNMDIYDGIGFNFLFMFIQGLAGCLMVFLIEFGFFHRIVAECCTVNDVEAADGDLEVYVEEDDVGKEKNRITNTPLPELFLTDSLLLVDLHKKYNQLTAVDHINVGIPEQECFGLLGRSGAGKTTIFRMLTGETTVTSGNAYLKGFDVRYNLRKVQLNVGYCPQFDAHIGEMTARETLTMYAHLRGIPKESIQGIVENLIDMVLLSEYTDFVCGSYSGGNKRKLSLAMALVGDPPFILLDEPSSGMDPQARRQMWNVLSSIRTCGRTLVLSSHSMEECDALCTRLAILFSGRFMCLGSPQHLKNKYGQGYTLIIKMDTHINGDLMSTEHVVEYIQSVIPKTLVVDDHQGYCHLHITDSTVEVADVFSLLESCKNSFNIEDYSVQETTLEQIFLNFAKRQELEDDDTEESCWFLNAGFFDDKFC
ncbi:hypothetical protein BsWGS_17948 [Bradybaena similaris]